MATFAWVHATSGYAAASMLPVHPPPMWAEKPEPQQPLFVSKKPTTGTWTDISGFPGHIGPGVALQLTDGSLVVDDWCTNQFYRLTPDKKGKYESGTWSAIAAMPKGYYPNAFATQILPDGRLIVNGGVWSYKNGDCGSGDYTNKGALYDPVADKWIKVSPPSGWSNIGDPPSAILPDGQYMLANCCSTQEAIASIKGNNIVWSVTGSGKSDNNGNEGWTILPGGNLLTVDTGRNLNQPNDYEIYDTSTGTWSTPGTTASSLVDPNSQQLGAGVLRFDGTVIQFGGTGHNNLYDPSKDTWVTSPDFPVIDGLQYDEASGPAALLPDGNVLVMASPGFFQTPSHFFEYSIDAKGKQHLNQVNDSAEAGINCSCYARMLELPTGQVFMTAYGEIATYTPTGKPKSSWLPVISSVSSSLTIGSTKNPISGKNFNGFSQGAMMNGVGSATNYPLVRITNNSTNDVCFGRSYNFSTMGVWNTGKMHAHFDVPSSCESGASTLQVIVNGLASTGVSVTLN